MTNKAELLLRWYRPEDGQQLVDMYACCFPEEDWQLVDLKRFSDKTGQVNIIKCLVDTNGILHGSLFYTLTPKLCRIRRITVCPEQRRNGLACFMLHTLCGPQSLIRSKHFQVKIREDNLAAINLFSKKMHFTFDAQVPRQRDKSKQVDFYEFNLTR